MLVNSNLTNKLMLLIIYLMEETLDPHSIRVIKALDIHKHIHNSSTVSMLNKILRCMDKIIFKTMLKVTHSYKTIWAIFTKVTKTPNST